MSVVDSVKSGSSRSTKPIESSTPGNQFYIVQNKNGEHRLDKKFTVYGMVFQGMDVIDKIVAVPRDSTDTPNVDISLDVNIINMTGAQLKEKGFIVPAKN